MQGIKDIEPKMFYQVHLDNLVPQNNFYRLLDKSLNLSFLYKATKKYYGAEGQESLDPVVFFKICLTGYLNNINSDRKLMEYCSDSLAVRLYLRYDIDESLPWHSTINSPTKITIPNMTILCPAVARIISNGVTSELTLLEVSSNV